MKPTAIALAAALAAAAPVALAGGGSFQDTARVKDVDPEYERVNVPRKECWSEYVPESRYERNGGKRLVGPLIGGVAGGLLGSQIGKGNGKVAAAAAGDLPRARELHYRLLPLIKANFVESNPVPVKTALAMLGLCEAIWRPPLGPPAEPTRRALRDALRHAGLEVGHA